MKARPAGVSMGLSGRDIPESCKMSTAENRQTWRYYLKKFDRIQLLWVHRPSLPGRISPFEPDFKQMALLLLHCAANVCKMPSPGIGNSDCDRPSRAHAQELWHRYREMANEICHFSMAFQSDFHSRKEVNHSPFPPCRLTIGQEPVAPSFVCCFLQGRESRFT